MRKRSKNKDISVHAIAGTEVVLLGINATEEARKGLLGFSIYRSKGNGKELPLGTGKIFEGVHREASRGRIRSDKAPIQSFMWSDYAASPNTLYTYRVVPVYGKPGALKPGKGVSVKIRTENPEDRAHAVFFNRGVAGSQAYSRNFGNYRKWYLVDKERNKWQEFVKPEDVPDRKAYKWLSRGLEEAMLGFIAQAAGPEYSLRAAIYELTHLPAIQAFVDAMERGADVKIVHHAKRQRSLSLKQNFDADVLVNYADGKTPSLTYKNREVRDQRTIDAVGQAADEAISQIGLSNPENQAAYRNLFIERTITQISHNKFIILLKKGKPIQVWTGSTNLTAGGIYGQSNVGHVVRDAKVAQKYFEYWQKLATDPKKKSSKSDPADAGLQNWTVLHQPDLKKGQPPPKAITPVFSPRLTNAMLDWYADRLAAGKSSVHFTAAFTVANQIFEKVTKKKRISAGQPYLRYLLLEGISGLMKKKYPIMAKCPQNRIAWGDTLRKRQGDDQLIETLTGLNDHVSYLHTKYMLIDPLTDDPVVITGSANFSDASTVNNDENMIIIRGNTRVADIFLGEFMRLFNHFHFRNRANARTQEQAARSHYLANDDSWTKPYYFKGSQECQERLLFA